MEMMIIMALLCAFIGYKIDGGRGLILGLLGNVLGLCIAVILASRSA